MKQPKIPIKKLTKLCCPKCGELQIKIYPWSSFNYQGEVPLCIKCTNEVNAKNIKN